MNLAFSFQASIIKIYADHLSWQLRREGGELDRLDGYILDNNRVEAMASDGLVAVANDLRKLAEEIEQRTDQVIPQPMLQAAE
jgi:hypothetical protein